MLTNVVFAWILYTLNAPGWIWGCLVAKLIMNVVTFGIDMFKAGSKL